MTFRIGVEAELTHEVRAEDLATSFGNDVPVLATPILLWLAEMTAMRAIESELSEGQITVGFAHRAEHLAPTPEGFTVAFKASLLAVDNKRLRFSVSAHDGIETVFSGEHDRFVVSGQRFREKARRKSCEPVGADQHARDDAQKTPTPHR
jgi:fluoroacetyl-CoA thioesterase